MVSTGQRKYKLQVEVVGRPHKTPGKHKLIDNEQLALAA